MRVQEVMSDDVRTVPSAMPALQARSLMKTDKIHHLVVVDGRRIVGVLSERDARRARGATTVEQLMTKAVVTIEHDATVRKAANALRGGRSAVARHARQPPRRHRDDVGSARRHRRRRAVLARGRHTLN
jgi:CBS domain-containing protein